MRIAVTPQRLAHSRAPLPHAGREIDLIAKRGKIVAAIEGKARHSLMEALEAVTPHQRHRIERAAAAFLSQHPKWRNLDFRFDVMAAIPRQWPKHVTDA